MASKQKQPKQNNDKEKKITPLRILMLHGYYQSGDALSKKTGSFRKIINKFVEFVYVTAPNEVDKSEQTLSDKQEDANDGPVYKWWDVPPGKEFLTTDEYVGDKDSLQYIREVFRNQGPFDGILGFSQGGVFASILCGLRAGDEPTPDNPIAFRFAIIVSAFTPSASDYIHLFDDKSKLPPTLHLYGKGDTLILPEWSKSLSQLFPNPVVVEHDGGHYIPVTSAPKQAYKKFLEPFLR